MFKSFLQSREWGEFQRSLGREVILEPVVTIKHILKKDFYYWYVPRGESIPHFDLDSKCVFVRVEPNAEISLPRNARKVKNIQPGKTLVLDLNKNEEELLSAMHPKTRYNIKIAERHGLEVDENEQNSAEAISLLDTTAKRQGYKGHNVSYYEKLLDFFSTTREIRTSITTVRTGEELLAVGLYIDFNETRTYLFGGSSENNKNLMAPYLLHWYAIRSAKNSGMKIYDFWGIETASGTTPGFVRFKLGFGGMQIEYPGAYDIVNKPIWYNGYKILRKINRVLK